jgi:geranylgeranyl diphosphate synthase type II
MQSFNDLLLRFEERITNTLPLPAQPAGLYEPCRYFLALGGKRVRPILSLMACELFDEITEDAWHVAAAVELFHNFTLVHDDIMDKAPLRRGKETLHTKYGLTAGILCGDVLCIYAYERLTNVGSALPQILRLFNKTAIEVCEGQQMDMDFELRDDVGIDEYITMITLKTSVLLAASLKMGALAGGAMGDNARKLYEFGKNMGIAFQLQDDYLDAFGDVASVGKQSGGDIIANKKTYLLLKAQENATPEQQQRIAALLGSDANDKVANMLQLYKETGADVACRDAVAAYSALAFASLEDVAVPQARKAPLTQLAHYLLDRDR